MAGPGGKEIGRLTVRVLPDTDGFREKVKKELEGFGDIEIGLDLVADDFRSEVSRAVKAAQAGQKVEVPLVLDRRNLENLGKVNSERVKVPIDVDKNKLDNDIKNLKLPSINAELEPDRKKLDDSLAGLKPKDIKVDVEPNLKKLNPGTIRLDPLEVPVEIDSSKFNAKAREARALAAAVLERQALIVKLEGQDNDLRNKIAKAKADLQQLREFGVDIEMDANTEPLRQKIKQVELQLDKLNNTRSTPEVRVKIEAEEARLASLQARLAFFANKDYTAEVNVKIDQGVANLRKLEAQAAATAAKKHKMSIDFDVRAPSQALKVLEADTSRSASQAGKILKSTLGNALESVGSGIVQAGTSMSRFTDRIAAFGQKMQGVQMVTGAVFQYLLKLPAMATALAVAGAGITVAFGAVATAVAAINPALALLGLGFASVYMGLDGIKAAAKTIQPELDRIKTSVSAAFQNGLTPAFERLKTLFETVRGGLNSIAVSISAVGDRLSKMLVSMDKAGQLAPIFQNVHTAIDKMAPGIEKIVGGMLRIMGLKSGFDALAGAVDAFGAAFDQSVTKTIADGSLDRAFQGLEQVLRSVSRAFVGLVENGLKSFAGSAPGVAKFIDSLTSFFGRFDWERLGKAAGDVFEGIGAALDGVDDATIEAITKAFEDLGAAFKDPKFQQGLQSLIKALPGVIDLMTQFVDAFSDGAQFIGDVSKFVDDVANAISDLDAKIDEFLRKHGLGWLADFFSTGAGSSPIGAGIGGDFFGPLKDAWDSLFSTPDIDTTGITEAIEKAVRDGIANGFDALKVAPDTGGSAFSITLNAEQFNAQLTGVQQRLADALKYMLDLVTVQMGYIRQVFELGFEGIGLSAQTDLTTLQTTFSTAMQLLLDTATIQMGYIRAVFDLGFDGIGLSATTALQTLQTTFSTALQLLLDTATIQMGYIRTVFDLAFEGIGLSAITSLTNLQTIFNNALLLMLNTATVQLEAIRLAFELAFTNITITVTTQMVAVQNAFINGLATIITILQTQMNLITVTVQAAMTAMTIAVQTGMVTIQNAFINGLATITTILQTQMNLITTTVQSGMTAMATSVQIGMVQVVNSFRNGFLACTTIVVTSMAAMVAAVTAGMSAMAAAVQAGIAQIVAAVVGGLATIVASWVSGWARVLSAVISAFAGIVSAAISGMAQVVSAVTSGVQRVISTVTSLLPSGLRSAGANAIRALADAIRAGASAVISAATWVAQQAIAAAKWALGIKSPSREFLAIGAFMMKGWSNGVDDEKRSVVKSVVGVANALVREATKASAAISSEGFAFEFDSTQALEAIDAVSAMASSDLNASVDSDGFGDIGDRVATALEGWSVVMDSNGLAKLVNKSNIRKERRR